ncbi:MAG: TonB-dependent receptor [Woeseiaceae bacterium]|nr:TonB-dependent receptor [Woeseiaceae bacterium]
MTDRPEASPWLKLLGGLFVSATLALSPAVFAQDDADADDAADEEDATEEIVVTGSRLKRDTYSSISPLQIITGQISREVGLIDAADILQESSAAGGQQIDLTFQGFVLDNGPGATTIDLRGLGAARTLVLINGRRMAPAGVEGAPVAANLNQVPASLVQQYDLLLDGASSVYGSDAIAGVANVILRKDFDGFEAEIFSRVPEYSNGVDHTLSASWGRNFDRGFVGIGVEYTESERVRLADRPWTEGCNKNAEIDENGNIRTADVFYSQVYGMDWDECRLGLLAGRVSVPDVGSIYHTPGFTNGGWPNFSESSIFGFGVDGDGDGRTDLTFRDYDLNGKDSQQNSDLFPENETTSFMAFGEYTFEGEMNLTPYFEILYSSVDFFSNSSEGQLFPFVPANNPFNLCNPANPNGVDCGDAADALYNNPNFVNQVLNAFGCDPSAGGSCDQTIGSIGAARTRPIVSVAGDRNFTDVEGEQTRIVGGIRGDLPFIDFGSFENWSFDMYYTHTLSDSNSFREGIRVDRLDLALGYYSDTNTPCEISDPSIVGFNSDIAASDLASDVAPGCVPVNMFAPELYPVGVVTGDFATAAERNYLFDNRDFDTEYEQTIFSAYATGDVAELPGGAVAFGIGVEVRNDEIKSIPDEVARDGLFFGFFSDGGAVGEKWTNELFAEVELPLLAGVQAAEELSLNMSARYTDDEYYGGNWTESFKLGWRPVDYLLIRATSGTSYRAPNLRELFLLNQTGFVTTFDPCFIPDAAINDLTGGYDAAADDRDAIVLQNCVANGVDPTLANNNGFNSYSVESAEGGSLTLDAEESESWSAGFAWDLPNVNAFDLSVSATYYEIKVINTIIEPSNAFIVNDCYNNTSGTSPFCSRITRDLSDPTQPFMTFIDQGFLNRDQEKARGVDVNLSFGDTFTIAERPIDFALDVRANRLLERSTLFAGAAGSPDDVDAFQGEPGFATWRGRINMRFDYDDYRVSWETRYQGSVEQDIEGIDPFDEAVTGGSDACAGPPDDVLCRDIGFIENYFLHNISAYYFGDRWTIGGGIRNVFDENPPFVDGTEIQAVNNTPIGYGYDLNGRTYFLNVSTSFGGGE